MTPNRYAIYYLPDTSAPWAEFCTAWLGWDVSTGTSVPHPQISGLTPAISAITTVPRRYGLHATLKPPFRLKPGKSALALKRATEDLAQRLSPLKLDGLTLTPLGRFLALTLQGPTHGLNQRAAQIVRDLDMFRAEPTDQELARRRQANLSPDQEANLLRWGYPYVMDQFRFHITLTGRLPKEDLNQVQSTLSNHLKPILPEPFLVSDIALVGEDEDGFFHLIERFPLTGTA